MVFFASKHRVKQLPIYKQVALYPVAYTLKYLAGGIVYLGDKFDKLVVSELLTIDN